MSAFEYAQVFTIFNQVKPLLTQYVPDRAKVCETRFKEKQDDATPVIMVYGVYNGGKSTLINALLGQEKANVADKPETDKVDAYHWNGFTLLDTPGIDAPIAHQQVTDHQLAKTDVVIFVLSSHGTVEEEKTYQVILKLLEKGRRVIVVINNKTDLVPDSAAYLALKDKVRQNLQFAANAADLKERAASIPIEMVHAKTALKARLENKSNLLQHSGLPELEHKLQEFLSETKVADIINGLSLDLGAAIDAAITNVEEQIAKSSASEYDNIHKRIEGERKLIESELKSEIRKQERVMRNDLRSLMRNVTTQEQFDAGCQDLMQKSIDDIQRKLDLALSTFEENVASVTNHDKQLQVEGPATAQFHQEASVNVGSVNAAKLGDVTNKLHSAFMAVRKKDVVAALKLGKDYLPSLFKGIGVKKIDNFAKQVMGANKIMKGAGGKFLGAAIQIGTMCFEYWQASKQMEKEVEAKKRHELAIEEQGEKVARSFADEIEANICLLITDIFAPIFKNLSVAKNDLNKESAQLSSDAEQLRAYKNDLMNDVKLIS